MEYIQDLYIIEKRSIFVIRYTKKYPDSSPASNIWERNYRDCYANIQQNMKYNNKNDCIDIQILKGDKHHLLDLKVAIANGIESGIAVGFNSEEHLMSLKSRHKKD